MFILKKMLYFYNNKFNRNKIHYIHIGDIMTPIDGGLSVMQYTIVSRAIDIMNRENGGDFYWQRRKCELVARKTMSYSENKKCNMIFDKTIECLKESSLFGESSWLTAENSPFSIIDGTHRIGFYLAEGRNVFLPIHVEYTFKKHLFSIYDAESYLMNLGMSKAEVDELELKYYELIKKIRMELSVLIPHNKYCMFEEELLLLGIKIDVLEEKIHIDKDKMKNFRYKNRLNSRYSKFINNNLENDWILCRFELDNQNLSFDKGLLKSRYVDKLKSRFQDCYFCESVTESVGLENYIFTVKEYNYEDTTYC